MPFLAHRLINPFLWTELSSMGATEAVAAWLEEGLSTPYDSFLFLMQIVRVIKERLYFYALRNDLFLHSISFSLYLRPSSMKRQETEDSRYR